MVSAMGMGREGEELMDLSSVITRHKSYSFGKGSVGREENTPKATCEL
jgi:hypothetical protein